MARGHIRRRGTRWVGVYERERDPVSGKRRQGWVSGSTKKEVQEQLTLKQRERDTGVDFDASTVTVEAFLNRWLTTVVRHRVKPTTYARYQSLVTEHLIPALGHHALGKLRVFQVDACYAALVDRGLAPATVRLLHTVFRTALRQAVTWRLVRENVTDTVTAPTVPRPALAIWDEQTTRRFIESVKDDRAGPMFILAIATGLRRGEILALEWPAVDFERQRLTVSKSRVPVKGGSLVGTPKSGRSRVLDFSGELVVLLRAVRRQQREDRLRHAAVWQESAAVFTGEDGQPVTVRQFDRAWQRLLAESGLPRIRCHDLRHISATLLLSNGVNAKVVQERLGHHSAGFTLDRYAHAMPVAQQEAARLMGRLLFAEGEQEPPDAGELPA